jgi:hypothetical protein
VLDDAVPFLSMARNGASLALLLNAGDVSRDRLIDGL